MRKKAEAPEIEAASDDSDGGAEKGSRTGARISRPLWDKMREAYRAHPTVYNIMTTCGVGKKMARKAVQHGWPEYCLPPFSKGVVIGDAGTTVHRELKKVQQEWEEQGVVEKEAARQAAEEAMAARVSMQGALRMMKANHLVADKLIALIESGAVDLPEAVTPKLLFQLTKSMDAATQIVQRALEIERKRLGEPDQILGIQIGMMIEPLTEDELQQVYRTGEIPFRILSQHPARVLEAAFEQTPDVPQKPEELFAVTGDEGDELPELPDPPELPTLDTKDE